jgi:hypothetical protein
MLTKSIKEVLWKTVLANGCFCFHKMKLPMPDGLSAALIQPLRVVAGSPTRRYADTAALCGCGYAALRPSVHILFPLWVLIGRRPWAPLPQMLLNNFFGLVPM